ncbi:MAG TPA: prepilin peptidase [Gemmatimonadaceae bacterium]|nr:prepilin peptidase [Gemmatimonadaceae bacterium]
MPGLTLGSPAGLAAASALLALLAFACVIDVRERRIPNRLVAAVLVIGVVVSTAVDPVVPGLLRAVGGAAIGLAIWLPGWLLRMMGAGDVKLFGATGAWLGPAGAVNAAIAAAVIGGVLALAWMLRRRGRTRTGQTLWAVTAAPRTLLTARSDPAAASDLIPYSVAIVAGVLVQLALPGLIVG